jgi:hypothetical protein
VLVAGFAVAGALLLAAPLTAGGGAAHASEATAASASYAALTSDEPSGLPLVSSQHRQQPGDPEGPSWPAEAPEGAPPSWPQASSIRRVPLEAPGVSGWIATSIEGGICVLVSAGQPVGGVSAVYSGCAPEARLDRGATVEVNELPGEPGRYLAAGVVPDGVREVRFTMADGSTYTAPVHHNAWVRDSNQPAASGQQPTMIGGAE